MACVPASELPDQPSGDQPAYDQHGLVPAVVQDAASGDVLMLAWMDAPAYHATRSTGLATFYSRSRREQWVKGATSGNYLRVREVRLDCDRDTVLVRVDPAGPACHTGDRSCFDAGLVPLADDARQEQA